VCFCKKLIEFDLCPELESTCGMTELREVD
jgi:hypothetical protein